MNEKFIARLNTLLNERSMSQADLSKLTGIRPSSISDWLAGKYDPKQDKIALIAKALNTSPAWLIGYDDERQEPVKTESQYPSLTPKLEFGSILKGLRKERNLTQAELARLTSLKVSAISMYENGNREPNFKTLEILADFFSVDMDILLGRKKFTASDSQIPSRTPKDEREIARELENLLNSLDDKTGFDAVGDTVDDEEDKELLRASLLTSMRLARQIAKKKFTPKKNENKAKGGSTNKEECLP